MANDVELTVNSKLKKIIDELMAITAAQEEVGKGFKDMGKDVGKTMSETAKNTENKMNIMSDRTRKILQNIKEDFRTLLNIKGIQAGLKLSDQFTGSVKQAIDLSDAVRKVGTQFGWTRKQFIDMQSRLVKGLGEIGLGSDSAANAIMGIGKTAIRDKNAIMEYAKAAGQLAVIGKEKGSEGDIVQGLATVATQKGMNPNDANAMNSVKTEVLRIMQATGRSATEVLGELSQVYESAHADFKDMLAAGGSSSLAAAGVIAGPQADSFIKKYLSMDKYRRSGMEAQGLGKLMGADGKLSPDAFRSTIGEANRRGAGDTQFGLQTMGMSEDEAKGFILLNKAMQDNAAIVEKARTGIVEINKAYESSRSMGDAFGANIERIKSKFSGVLSGASQVGTDVLGGMSKTDTGAAVVSGGSAVAAAMLAGGGVRGIMSAGKEAAYEKMTGEKVQKVHVMNADEIGKRMGGFMAGGMGGKLMRGAGMATGGLAAWEIGSAIGDAAAPVIDNTLNEYTTGTTSEGFEGNALERLIFKLDKMTDFKLSGTDPQFWKDQEQKIKVKVEMNDPRLKHKVQNSRGVSQ